MAMSETENDQRVDSTDKAMGPSESLHDIPMTPERKSSASTNTKTEGAEPTAQEEGLEHEVIPELESPELEIGDHVYQWRSLCGVPYMFQHHGIVMDVIKDEEGNPVRLTIADFSNVEAKGTEKAKCLKGMENNSVTTKDSPTESAPKPEDEPSEDQPESVELEPPKTSQKRRSSLMFSSRQMSLDQITLEQEGLVRTYTDTDKWHKVRYQSGFWKRQLNRSGTVTGARSDPVGLVLARVNFIMQHPEKLPDYHVLHANCECVAFWCKTGNWSTLQASSFLELTAAGQAKQTATLAATAAGTTATVTVPASGIWGSWFGFTTTSSVSWLSLHPMAIPGLACYAAVTVGVPAVMYATAHKKWKETSERLSEDFWNSATENPDVFAECLTHWSEKG